MADTDALADCLVLNTVATARALTRRYDEQLRPHGVSVAQFVVLGAVRRAGPVTLTDLARRIAMDRTTLSRNVDLLVRKGLVRKAPSGAGNARHCELTGAGADLLEKLIPLWRAAQAALCAELGDLDHEAYLGTLRRLRAD